MNPLIQLLQNFNPNYLPKSFENAAPEIVQREIMLRRLSNTIILMYILFGPWMISTNWQTLLQWNGLVGILYLVIFCAALFRGLPYHARALPILVALEILGVFSLQSNGLAGIGPLFFIGATVLSGIFYRQIIGAIFTTISVASYGIIAWLFINHRIVLSETNLETLITSPHQWMNMAFVYTFVLITSMAGVTVTFMGFRKSMNEQKKLTQMLEDERASLEWRVEERAQDLRKRLNQFEIASQVARDINLENNFETLLNQAGNQIREQFNFYHVGIFLNDERNEYAILRAATGEAGRQMLERSHRLKIGEVGLVGYAISRGESRISLSVSDDSVHYKNPLLPDTRSEMALPLRLGDRTIGALDVQSVVDNAFSQDDVRLLQTIADQLAIAFEKTRLVAELQRSVAEMEAVQAASIQKAWKSHIRNARQRLAYRYHQTKLENRAEDTPQAQEALTKGQPVLKVVQEAGQETRGSSVLAVPIKMRNQVLGVVDIRFDSATVSPELLSLIEGTVNRLAVSLENARLLEEIQYRAERERLVSEISTKVRAAGDVDSVLRIAVQEIGQSLGVSEVMVQLRKD